MRVTFCVFSEDICTMDRIDDRAALQRLKKAVEVLSASRGWHRWIFLLVLFSAFYVIVLGLYYPALNSPMIYDSREWIQEKARTFERNDFLEVISIVPVRPFFMLTLYANYQLRGMDPAFFRLVNLAVLAATGTALFLFIVLLLETPGAGGEGTALQKQIVALVLSFIFVMHPLQRFVVLYIWQREAILACFFYISTLGSYVALRLGHYEKPLTGYLITGLLFFAGLCSKENVISVPIALLLTELALFGQSVKILWRRGLSVGLITIPGLIVYMLVTQSLFSEESELARGVVNRLHAYYSAAGLTVVEVLMTECRVFFRYLASILVPVAGSSTMVHAMTISTSLFTPPTTALACAGVSGLVLLGFVLVRREPLISFAILLTFICLAPESLFIPQYLVFSYRAILPMAALLLIAGVGLLRLWSHDRQSESGQYVSSAIIAISLTLVIGLAVFTHSKARGWHPLSVWMEAYENLPPWSESVEKQPYVDVLTNLSGILANKRETANRAISLCTHGLLIEPGHGMLQNNMGVAYLHVGDAQRAVKHLETAVDLRPDSSVPLNNLGNALLAAQRIPEAVGVYAKAIQLEPNRVEPYLNMGAAFLTQQQYEDAVRILENAAAIKPGHSKVRANLGIALLRVGRVPEAITHLSLAVERDPNLSLAHYHLGIAFENVGQTVRAAHEYSEVVRRSPNWAEGRLAWGRALLKLGNIPRAMEQYQRVLQQEPDNFAAHNDMARAFLMVSEFEKAAKHAREALKLKPGLPEAQETLERAREGSAAMDSTERECAQ